MATIVCQGLQSCLESHHVHEPRTLRLKLSSPKPQFSPHHQPFELTFNSCFFNSTTKKELDDEEKCQYDEEISRKDDTDSLDDDKHGSSNAADSACLSFFEALSNGSQLISSKSETTTDKQNTYVHPKVKRSLSDKSLELCTENLGSETGSDTIKEDSIFPLSNSSSSDEFYGGDFPTREQKRSRQLFGAKKASTNSRSRSFPPPLTTITGFESLQVRPHREDGRLIIKAIKAPSTHCVFQAERSHGRLRLFLYKDNSPPFSDSEGATADESSASADNIEGYNEEDEIDNDANCAEEEANPEEHEDGDDEEEKLESDASNWGEEINGNRKDVGGEMVMKKFQRPGRCNESETTENKGLLNWEALRVATS